MAYIVDYLNPSINGFESSPLAEALAGLRANEARYFMNKYNHRFTTVPADQSQPSVNFVHKILKEERDIEISAKPLETTHFQVENIDWTYVFYQSGLEINVLYAIDNSGKRAVGFKLSEGMPIPAELATKFKFAKQRSRLAGTIRGSYFVIKGEYL